MDNYTKLANWLKVQEPILDEIIYNAAYSYWRKHKTQANFAYDLDQCQKESYKLSKGEDLCYDRPNTGFVYSLWYQARRINTFLSLFSKKIVKSSDTRITIFDLGAGTGAVQLAVGLIIVGMEQLGFKNIPQISMVNIDSSPIMLNYGKLYIWNEFQKKYAATLKRTAFKSDYAVNSWNRNATEKVTNVWISASYLFDITDKLEETAKDFQKIIDTYEPRKVFLLTSSQSKKETLLNHVEGALNKKGYLSSKFNNSSLLINGYLSKVNRFRKELNSAYAAFGLGRAASWRDNSYTGIAFELPQKELSFGEIINEPIDLYNPPIKNRTEILLSGEQKKAANHFTTPSIIIGPAGSGKSIVVSEKVAEIVKYRKYDPKLKILVTSFNKMLIQKLGDWIEELLDSSKIKRTVDKYSGDQATKIFFNGSATANIRILHFDLLPTRIGDMRFQIQHDAYHRQKIEEYATDLLSNTTGLTKSQKAVLADADFLLEEYKRIFYGLGISNRDEYLNVDRKGRWKVLGKQQREYVFSVIRNYAIYVYKNKKDSFTIARKKFLNKLKEGRVKESFEYIFVDEFQDCTRADFQIFWNLFHNSDYIDNLTIAGDLAQSIHIGKSAQIPRDSDMKRRQYFYLTGSYRLPQRISEAIMSLSENILDRFEGNNGAAKIAPVKGAPPGARPIVIYGRDEASLVKKLIEVWNTYQCFDLDEITILESDLDLFNALNNKLTRKTDTILKLKGLEKKCILWSTRRPIEDSKETHEFVYTILTRTSAVLIIALFDNTVSYYKEILKLLDKEKLIFWDQETAEQYYEFTK
jgi:DNA helicase-2/ATP-dependent DNA helicase PcrA